MRLESGYGVCHFGIGHRVIVRPPRPTELDFVVQTYVRGAGQALHPIERTLVDWPSLATRLVGALVEREGCLVAGSESGDTIAGYVLFQRDSDTSTVHWVQTKSLYKGRGVASMLVEAAIGDPTRVVATAAIRAWQREKIRAQGWKLVSRLPWLWLLQAENDNGDAT